MLQIDRIESIDDIPLNVQLTGLIPNPKYSAQYWPAYDVGLIKTTNNHKFLGSFQMQEHKESYIREAVLLGCGRVEYDRKFYSRTMGENSFLQIGAVLFFKGENGHIKAPAGINVSVGPNDSGGPILDKITGKIVGLMTTTTIKGSTKYGVPTISTGTSTAVAHNFRFIRDHMGPIGH